MIFTLEATDQTGKSATLSDCRIERNRLFHFYFPESKYFDDRVHGIALYPAVRISSK